MIPAAGFFRRKMPIIGNEDHIHICLSANCEIKKGVLSFCSCHRYACHNKGKSSHVFFSVRAVSVIFQKIHYTPNKSRNNTCLCTKSIRRNKYNKTTGKPQPHNIMHATLPPTPIPNPLTQMSRTASMIGQCMM